MARHMSRAHALPTCRTDKPRGEARLYSCRCASSCHSLTMTLDGNLIASGHFDGALRFWDVRSGREARVLKGLHEQQICSVAVGLLGGESSGR